MIVTANQRNGEGTVFSHVCHSVCLHSVLSAVGNRLKYILLKYTTGNVSYVPNKRYGCSACTMYHGHHKLMNVIVYFISSWVKKKSP